MPWHWGPGRIGEGPSGTYQFMQSSWRVAWLNNSCLQAATIAKRRRAFLAKESSSSDKITFSHVMGVTIPLSGVMLLTLVGNLILHLRIKSYEAKQV